MYVSQEEQGEEAIEKSKAETIYFSFSCTGVQFAISVYLSKEEAVNSKAEDIYFSFRCTVARLYDGKADLLFIQVSEG